MNMSFDLEGLLRLILSDLKFDDRVTMFVVVTSYLILCSSMILIVANAYDLSIMAEMKY